MRRLIAVLALCATSLSCDGYSDASPIDGAWVGYHQDRRISVVLQLSQGTIYGSGNITAPDEDLFDFDGTYAEGEVNFSMSVGFRTGASSYGIFSGELHGDSLVGQLSGSAFEAGRFAMRRPTAR